MSTALRKKEFERTMLQGLLNQLEIQAEFISGEFESPDLAIICDGITVGVEVTEIQKSKEARARRAPKDDILKRAREGYEARLGPPISVSLSFLNSADVLSINRSDLSQSIVEFLLGLQIEVAYDVVIRAGDDLPLELRQYFREVRCWREDQRGVWQCSEASWVAPLTKDILQERVDAKGELLSLYRTKGYENYWLLICAHPTNPACRFEIARDLDPAHIISPFDRTFFFDCWQTIELGVASPSN